MIRVAQLDKVNLLFFLGLTVHQVICTDFIGFPSTDLASPSDLYRIPVFRALILCLLGSQGTYHLSGSLLRSWVNILQPIRLRQVDKGVTCPYHCIGDIALPAFVISIVPCEPDSIAPVTTCRPQRPRPLLFWKFDTMNAYLCKLWDFFCVLMCYMLYVLHFGKTGSDRIFLVKSK